MRIGIHGATGFTGRLVIAKLLAERANRGTAEASPIIAIGRNERRLAEIAAAFGDAIEVRRAELFDRGALDRALGGVELLINCAGPFAQFGEVVLRACLRAGAHYLDTTGEQTFMRESYERYDSAARRAGVCAINGCAFEVAIGDWAASLAARLLLERASEPSAQLDELSIMYAIDHLRVTGGTARSALAQLAAGGVSWESPRWEPARPASHRRTFGLPAPFGERMGVSFPAGEIITVPRHVRAKRVRGFAGIGGLAGAPMVGGALLGRLSPLLGLAAAPLARSGLAALAESRWAAGGEGPTAGERRIADFAVAAVAQRGFAAAQVAVLGSDVYGTTADVLAYAVNQLEATPPPPGILPPALAFDPKSALTALGLRVEVGA